jgi:hypothetical protein
VGGLKDNGNSFYHILKYAHRNSVASLFKIDIFLKKKKNLAFPHADYASALTQLVAQGSQMRTVIKYNYIQLK